MTRADGRSPPAARRAVRWLVRSAWSSASSGRSDRSARGRAASGSGPSWSAGARLVTSDGEPIARRGATFDQLVTVFPDGHVGVDDSQVVLLRMPPDLLTDAHDPGRRARRLGRLLEDLHPRRVLGRACSASTTASPTRCASWCARATSRSSTPSTAPGRSVVRPTRSLPQLALDVDDDGYLVARGRLRPPGRPARMGRSMSVDTRRPHRRARCSGTSRASPGGSGRARSSARCCTRCSRTTSRSSGASWPCTASSCSLVTGTYLTFFFEGSQETVIYDGLVRAAAGRRGVGRLRLRAAHLLRRQGWAADPPDAPLGGARVHRRPRPAHGAGLLHRRLPPSPRDQLGRRRRCC